VEKERPALSYLLSELFVLDLNLKNCASERNFWTILDTEI
jgi:hypothetical protein